MTNSSLYFTSVAGLQNGAAVVGCHLVTEGLSPSITRFMFMHNGSWGHWFDIEDVVYSIGSKPRLTTGGKANVTALTRGGRCWEMISGGEPNEVQLDVTGGYYMLNMSHIDTDLFCCGVQNMVFQVQGQSVQRIDQGIFQPLINQVDRALEAIHGFTPSDVYAAGHSGKIWHWNGKAWKAEASLTDLDLFAVHCSSSGRVIVAGGAGTVLCKDVNGTWNNLTVPEFSGCTIRNIAEFENTIYLAASDRLLRINRHAIEEVIVNELSEVKGRFYAISSDGERLWAAGDNALLCFDGTSWAGYIAP